MIFSTVIRSQKCLAFDRNPKHETEKARPFKRINYNKLRYRFPRARQNNRRIENLRFSRVEIREFSHIIIMYTPMCLWFTKKCLLLKSKKKIKKLTRLVPTGDDVLHYSVIMTTHTHSIFFSYLQHI